VKKKFLLLGLLAIAFAYIEAGVVVYLRELYYPEGFSFPLKLMPLKIFLVELGRELSTLVVLFTAGFIVGKNLKERFAYFIYNFACWDIFYYFWLKIILNWPESLLTWDILFLIPVAWTGPVLAPIIVSLTLLLFAFAMVYFSEKKFPLRMNRLNRLLLVCVILLIFLSFIWNFPAVIKQEIPKRYPWEIFLFGELLGIVAFLRIFIF